MEPTNQGEAPQEVAKLSQVIQIDEGKIQAHLGEVVRSTVEETLNAMLDAEADRLCRAERYERTEARQDTRAGSYQRQLHTKVGEVRLKVPKLRTLPFETAIIERYRRRESSVEEALVEMYLAGVSVRRVEDITEALWGTRVSPSTVSELNQKIYAQIETWRNRPIEGNHPYVFLDGLWLKRSWGGEVRNVSLLVAIGVNEEGFREVLAVAEGSKEWQRCTVHFYRNVWTAVPTNKVKEVAAMLKAIHAQEDRAAARQKAEQVTAKLREMKLADAAAIVTAGIEETLYYYAFPREHWRCLRTNNPLERLLREVRRRTRAVGAFPDGKSALMLAAARLRHVAGTRWGMRRYLDMNRLTEASEAA
jgi:putative transposase